MRNDSFHLVETFLPSSPRFNDYHQVKFALQDEDGEVRGIRLHESEVVDGRKWTGIRNFKLVNDRLVGGGVAWKIRIKK